METENKYRKLDPIDAINKILADMGYKNSWKPVKHQHRYIYWNIPRDWQGTQYHFGYTPWKTTYNGKTGFFAVKYRLIRKGAKLVKAIRFGKRKVARQHAHQWFEAYYKK